jgi:hypothetical protein
MVAPVWHLMREITVHIRSLIEALSEGPTPKWEDDINPLKAELNPIWHSLILLGELTFMGPCILSIFQYISNKMQRYIVYLYLEIAVHVSGGTPTHHQERIQLYLQHLVFVTPLLSAAIVEKL